jgi:hypothetical protein
VSATCGADHFAIAEIDVTSLGFIELDAGGTVWHLSVRSKPPGVGGGKDHRKEEEERRRKENVG